MLDSKQKFQELVKQMKALQENEKGQLKGGFIPIPSKKSLVLLVITTGSALMVVVNLQKFKPFVFHRAKNIGAMIFKKVSHEKIQPI